MSWQTWSKCCGSCSLDRVADLNCFINPPTFSPLAISQCSVSIKNLIDESKMERLVACRFSHSFPVSSLQMLLLFYFSNKDSKGIKQLHNWNWTQLDPMQSCSVTGRILSNLICKLMSIISVISRVPSLVWKRFVSSSFFFLWLAGASILLLLILLNMIAPLGLKTKTLYITWLWFHFDGQNLSVWQSKQCFFVCLNFNSVIQNNSFAWQTLSFDKKQIILSNKMIVLNIKTLIFRLKQSLLCQYFYWWNLLFCQMLNIKEFCILLPNRMHSIRWTNKWFRVMKWLFCMMKHSFCHTKQPCLWECFDGCCTSKVSIHTNLDITPWPLISWNPAY